MNNGKFWGTGYITCPFLDYFVTDSSNAWVTLYLVLDQGEISSFHELISLSMSGAGLYFLETCQRL